MKRNILKKILLDFGYSSETVNKIFQLKTRPTLLKAIELEQKHNIPCTAWENIRLFITSKENDTKEECSKTTTKTEKKV